MSYLPPPNLLAKKMREKIIASTTSGIYSDFPSRSIEG
jgi:hypothetical protein